MTAAELIALGKTAVEAELSRIETDFKSAEKAALTKGAVLAGELQVYLEKHAAEVQTATALVARAKAIAAPATITGTAAVNTSPTATLNVPVSIWSTVVGYVAANKGKTGVLAGIALVVVHYLLGKVF